MNYINRTLEDFFKTATNQFPAMLVTGPRQTGKTTFLKHLSNSERHYVTLDDPIIRSLAKDDPALFLQRFKVPILIDEIQYAPNLLSYIKISIDKNPSPGQFWLTGSQQFHLMKNVSESLAGRVGIVNLQGFSQNELKNRTESLIFTPSIIDYKINTTQKAILLPELYHKIWLGSFPALHKGDLIDRDLFYSSYVQTYLQRDVRDLANVGNESSFFKFLKVCAARTGQILNMRDLCRDSDINHATGKNWLSILQSSGIVYLLEPFHSNINKRLIKSPKIYFLDTGLAAWLSEWSTPETLEVGVMSGAFLETWVLSEILKSWWHNGKQAPIFYYRDKDKKEVDLLIYRDGTIFPIEIKKTASPKKDMIRHFKVLNTLKIPIGPGCLICLATDILPITDAVTTFPVGYL